MENIKLIAIAGAGTMGSSMAEIFSKFGYSVILYDISSEALNRALGLIKINQQTELSHNCFTPEESDALLSRIELTTCIDELERADFVVEAVIEDIGEQNISFGKKHLQS